MNTALIKEVADAHFEGDQGKAREFIKASKPILDCVASVLKNKEQSLQVPSKADYDSPSWAYKQADVIGERRGLLNAASLVEVR